MWPLWLAVLAGLVVAYLSYRWGRTRATVLARGELQRTQRELDRRLEELQSLQELTYILSEPVDSERTVRQVARYVARFIGARGSLVALSTVDRLNVAAAEGCLEPLAGREVSLGDAAPLERAMSREQLQLLEQRPGEDPLDLLGVPVERAAIVPLLAHGEVFGVIAVAGRDGGPYTAEDVGLMTTVATHISMVLANARFFELLRRGKEEWESTFDALSDGVAVVDSQGRIARVNRSLAELMDHPISTLIGRSLDEMLFGGSGRLSRLIAESSSSSQPVSNDEQSHPLGRLLRVTATPMRGRREELTVILISDTTEQKRLETQLIQNEKMAAVGQLVSGVAHELNNPLASIGGLSEFLLEKTPAGAADREHLRVISQQAERAGNIVQNLLTFARRNPGDESLVDLSEIADRALQLIRYELKLRGIALETHLDSNLPRALGDRGQLQQVVLNILTNAYQALEALESPGRIVVATRAAESDVVLEVRDTGPGIADAVLPEIFTPFFTTKDPGHGTGLGLSISYRIVEQHGGLLSAYNAPDGGAVFVLKLPVAAPAPETEPPPVTDSEQTQPGRMTPSDGSSRRVLLLDDDPAVENMIRVVMREMGIEVVAAESAEHALQLLEHGDFHLLISDARMAATAGETIGETVRRRWPEMTNRTLLLTTDVRPETDEWLAGLGMRYFHKPFKIQDLRDSAEEVLLREQ